MSGDISRLDRFLAFSAVVTAFSTVALQGTGLAVQYLSTVDDVVGADVTDALLEAFGRVQGSAPADQAALENLLRREVLSDEKLGPVARSIIKLWYIGTWYELSPDWTDTYGARENNTTFVVSAAAYTEGLLWPAIGANPHGAKGPGYGSWAGPPRIPDVDAVL
jgi:hypothetical protein